MEYYTEKAKAKAGQMTKLEPAILKPPPPLVLPTMKETGGFPSNRLSAPRVISIPPRDPPDKHPNDIQPELLYKVTGTTISTPSADTEGTSLSVPVTRTSESSQGSSAAAIRVSGARRQEKRNEMQPTKTSSTNRTGKHATEPTGTAPGKTVSGAIGAVSHSKKVTTDRGSVKMARSNSSESIDPWPRIIETVAVIPPNPHRPSREGRVTLMSTQQNALSKLRGVWWQQHHKKNFEIHGPSEWREMVSQWISQVNTADCASSDKRGSAAHSSVAPASASNATLSSSSAMLHLESQDEFFSVGARRLFGNWKDQELDSSAAPAKGCSETADDGHTSPLSLLFTQNDDPPDTSSGEKWYMSEMNEDTKAFWRLNSMLADTMCSHGRLIKEPVFTKSYSIVDHINMVLGLNWEEFKMLRYLPVQFSLTIKACLTTACRTCTQSSSITKLNCICGQECAFPDGRETRPGEDNSNNKASPPPTNACATGLSMLLWGLCMCDYPSEFVHEPDGPFVSKNKAVQNLLHLEKIKQKFARFREAQRNVQRNVQKRLSRFSEPADGDVLAKASTPAKQRSRPEPEISNLNIAQRLEVMVKIMQFFKRSEYHVTPLVSHMILRSNILHCVAAIIETIDPASSTVSLLQIAALDWAMALYCDEKLRDLVLLQYVTLNDKHRVKATHRCNKPPILSSQDMLGYIPYLRKSIAGRIISKAKPVATYNGKSLSRAGELCKAQELPPTHQYHTDLGLLAKDMLEEFGDNLQHDLGLIGLKRILYMRKVTRSESWSSWIFQGNNQVNKVPDADFLKGFYFPEGFKREFEATEEATQRLLKDITQTWPRQFIVRYNEEKPDLIRVLVAGRKCSDHEGGLFEFHFMVPKCYPLYPLKAMLGIPNGVIEKPFGADVCNEINMMTYGQTGSIRDDIIKMAEGIFKPVEEIPDVTTGDTAAILNSLALRYQENSALYKCVVHGMNRWFDAPETGDLGGFRIAKTHPVWGEAVNMWFLLNSRQLAQKASMIHTRLLRPWKEYDSNAKLPSSLTPVRKGIINTQITARAAERLFRLSVVWEAYLKNTQTHTTGAKGEVDGVGVGSLFVGDVAED